MAAVDDIGNVGETTPALAFKLPIALKVSALGSLKKGKTGKLTISVTDSARIGIRGAKVTITGAGLRKKITTTRSNGKTAVLKLRPRRREKVTITVSKTGYKTTTLTITVR